MGGTAYAEVSVGSGLVVAFIAVIPVMIAALNLFWGEVPTPLEAAGIAFGLAGVVMLTQGQGFGASPEGLIAISLACITWCLGTVWTQRSLPLAAETQGMNRTRAQVVSELLNEPAAERRAREALLAGG